MKNYLYKLIFPVSGKLYFGRAAHDSRYPNNKPNEHFVGPHHNVEVQNLLDSGEFCYWMVVREFETSEEVEKAEETYLKKVWPSNDWESRPRWLLNRNRSAVGGGGKLNVTEEQFEKFQRAGAASKGGRKNKGNRRPDVSVRMQGNKYGSASKGKKRSDVSAYMRGNDYGKAHKGRRAPWNEKRNSTPVSCPHCERLLGNVGALANHVKKCLTTNSHNRK